MPTSTQFRTRSSIRKHSNKFDKYNKRMLEIMGGKCKKCPNTPENMTIIAAEFGKEGEILSRLLVCINEFPPEFKKQLLDIFGELFALNTYPNPLAESFDPHVDNTVEKLMDNFEEPGMSATAAKIVKMMCGKLELSDHFLTIEFFKVLAGYGLNSNFEISSEALSLMQEILLPKDKKLQEKVSEFLNQNKAEVMEVFMNLFDEENYLVKREGMSFLQQILLDSKNNIDFYNYFVSEKNHLKFVMQSLNDDSTSINVEAFSLLMIFLKAPEESRGPRVNETLRKNRDPLLQFIEDFNPNPDKEDEYFNKQKEEAKDEIEMIS
mmetsp:Transcript_25726/g.25544  ORF Transcript_25726/g.25544 Transcript_25726/m.25544 type:complete len:322 (-) Transcript_25726:56-1021(-)